MKIETILKEIASNSDCELIPYERPNKLPDLRRLPEDLAYFYSHYKGLKLFPDHPYGIEICEFDSLTNTNQYLYPEDDVIWEELEGDISENWFLIAKSEELCQYISIDLSEERMGFCYDSFIETHAEPGNCLIIAKSFTELLENLIRSNGEHWYWINEDFEGYGDAYDD